MTNLPMTSFSTSFMMFWICHLQMSHGGEARVSAESNSVWFVCWWAGETFAWNCWHWCTYTHGSYGAAAFVCSWPHSDVWDFIRTSKAAWSWCISKLLWIASTYSQSQQDKSGGLWNPAKWRVWLCAQWCGCGTGGELQVLGVSRPWNMWNAKASYRCLHQQ